MLQKIHCDLLDIYGINWSDVSREQNQCIIKTVHEQNLIEENDELFGFVGTVDDDNVIGGYFIIQFPTELLHFTRDKTPLEDTTSLAETMLFVLFPALGRILVQNRRFQHLPLNMDIVASRLKDALSRVFKACGVGPLVSFIPTQIQVTREELIREFQSGKKVSRLIVTDPEASRIPEDFTYYNPERDRNAIIRESRIHDYPNLRRVDLTAKPETDLRTTHLGQDLVQSISDQGSFRMRYLDQNDHPRLIVKQKRAKYEFHLDFDGKQLSEGALSTVLERVSMDPFADVPLPYDRENDQQMPLFEDGDEFDANG